ncbi:uncharacterized protein LOC130797170 [Amaranthus tricolor]|uniref:uncharacterized protein LOC130797170 n=1 Tax=Amaranthus tricolor TaxID=29722 RepID=UPI002585ED16|nr:uncharacterized protein LOC130797170 [Amaranthus tricolor]
MKKLTIRKKAIDSKKKQCELSTEVGNVRVDDVLIESSELFLANVDGNADEVEDSSSDDDYTCVNEDEYENDSDLFAKNVVYGLDDVFIDDEEVRLILDKEVDEQNNTDMYFNDDEPQSDDYDLSALIDDEEGICSYPTFNPEIDFKGKINLSLGLKFPSTYVFRKALRYHAIECGYNYYYLHNGTNRISVYCYNRCDCMKLKGRIVNCVCGKEKKCYFKVHAVKLKDEETVQIRSYFPNHTCGHQHQNKKVTALYLAEKYIDDWRDNPTWELKAFKKRVNRELGCEVKYSKCYMAKRIAMKMLYGDASEEYSRVWDYAEAIRTFNPGSTAIVKCIGIDTPPPLFQRMYICLTACKEGFVAGCRPIIGVDGAHLKGKFPGVLLTAVGKDGNNNIFPIAWAVVETENVETWIWFLNLLVEDLRSVTASSSWVEAEGEAFTFMSDRQKGLVEALNSVVPECEIRFCCRHIWANFKIKFPGELFKQHFWSAARAYNKNHFDREMNVIKNISIDAYAYLAAIPAKHWSRHAFCSRSKSGMLLNNICEAFNNVLVEARAKPIISLMEWIRRYVMQRSAAKREGLSNFQGELMPAITKIIEKNAKEIYGLRVIPVDVYEFEVDDIEDCYVVNLANRTCHCGSWQLIGIPCKHAVACIVLRKLDAKDFVHEAYLIETYRKTYSPKFYGMPGHKMWPTTTLAKLLPPPYRKMPGRPNKRKRKKEVGEGKGGKKAITEFKQRRCGNCGEVGHYKKGCKNQPKPPPPTKTKSKGGRPKMGSSSTQQSTTNDVPSSSGQQQTQNAASTSCIMDQNSQI